VIQRTIAALVSASASSALSCAGGELAQSGCGRQRRPIAVAVTRAAYDEQPGQVTEEDEPDPAGHAVRQWRPEVPADDHHRADDRDDVHDEREEQVLGDQRNRHRRRRQDLGDEQQEDDEGQQDRDAHGGLLAGVSGQVEDADRQERDEDAGNDEVDGVE